MIENTFLKANAFYIPYCLDKKKENTQNIPYDELHKNYLFLYIF